MKKILGIALLLVSAMAAIWALFSEVREQSDQRAERLKILEKAREAKANKSLEKSLDTPVEGD